MHVKAKGLSLYLAISLAAMLPAAGQGQNALDGVAMSARAEVAASPEPVPANANAQKAGPPDSSDACEKCPATGRPSHKSKVTLKILAWAIISAVGLTIAAKH